MEQKKQHTMQSERVQFDPTCAATSHLKNLKHVAAL